MKKIFYLASIAALAFSSCAKDDTTQAELGTVTGGSKITAAMGTDTRTYLDENKQFRWEGTDAIAVYNDNAAARMNGTQFKMTEGDKSTVAVFNGPALNAKYNHLAFYPWTQQKAFTNVAWAKDVQIPGKANGTKGNILSYTENTGKVATIKVNIPATQEYYPGTFGNGVVPAISTRFDIAEDGSADVSMQPVADYLFVDIMSVEPIKELKLELRKGTSNNLYTIAGENALTSYLLADGSIRYYMGEPEDGSDNIKLVTNERAPEVSCHEANTYVFVVPAGILGMGNDVTARLYVNGATSTTFAATSSTDETTDTRAHNWQLNWKKKDASKAYSETNRVSREDVTDDSTLKNKSIPVYNKPLENTYFYMNDKDADGNVIPFVYNPKNTFIIEHEGHLLQYLTEYGNTGEALNQYEKDRNFGFRSAIICAEHTFDFSKNHIENMSDILEDDEYSRYERYFSAYLNGSFPVIDYVEQGVPSNVYKHTFTGIEYSGKMPVITGIYQPLAGMNGIFGQITGKVSDVSFSGIKAKVDYLSSNNRHPYNGLVLGSIEDGGSIANITVDAATGSAILNKANNAAYEALTITNAQNLNYIALDMDLTKDLEIKNWNAVSVVKNKVFGSLMATDNDGDSHHVVKLPSTAAYAKLSQVVGNHYSASNIFSIIAGKSTFRPVRADVTDLNVVSVLVGEKSYWTGDKFNVDNASYYGSAKLLPATYTDDYKIGDINVKGWFKLEYAEQLATGANEDLNAVIMRDMELGYAVNPWEMVTVNKLHGNGATVSNLYMAIDGVDAPNVPEYPDQADYDTDGNGKLEGTELTDYNTDLNSYVTITNDYANTGIAPVDAKEIRNLTVDGITLDIYTEDGTVVPGSIGGLALDADRIYNVTVKNLVMTGDGGGKNDEHYVEEAPVFIGWLVANSVNTTVENSNVAVKENTIKGYAGLVGKLTLTDNAGANIKNSKATITKAIQTPLTTCVEQAFADWAEAVYSCTPVAYVKNVSGVETTINMKGSGAPAFVFYAPAGDPIYVINDGASLQLKNTPAFDYPWSF